MEIVAQSDTGRVRRNNEDAVAFDADRRLAVLADGMGGLDAGEVASSIAVQKIMEALVEALAAGRDGSEKLLTAAVENANLAILDKGAETRMDMGTTVVTWLLTDRGQCFIAHVGDSRAYRLRSGVLRRLTSDHSMVQQMVDDGLIGEAEAQTAPNRNVITRALGLDNRVRVDVRSWVHTPGDVYLLCSDGLTDLVTEMAIEQILQPICASADTPEAADGAGLHSRGAAARPSLQDAASALVSRANDAGGHDNISVLLIRP